VDPDNPKKRSAICAGPGPTRSKTDPSAPSAEQVLLGHGQPRPGGNAWMLTHERWLGSQRFHEPALAATYAHYRAVLQGRDAQLEGIETDLAVWYDAPPFADAVHRLSAYRGMTRLGALTLASVVCDWRRFPGSASGALVSSHDRDLVEVVSRWPRRSPAALP
jgi:hypothetical protein